jgi:hypothetical protein
MLEPLIWIFFFYALYRFIRTAIQGAVNRGIRDYENQRQKQEHRKSEIKIDRKKIEDAKYEDLK